MRRPPHSGSLQLAWAPAGGRGSLQAGWRYTGSTRDYNFTGSGPFLMPMRAYSLLQLGGEWQFDGRWQLHGRVERADMSRHDRPVVDRTADEPPLARILGRRGGLRREAPREDHGGREERDDDGARPHRALGWLVAYTSRRVSTVTIV